MKKTILTLLAIVMILSMAVSVMAADGGSAAVSDAAANPGELAYVTVSLSDYAKATGIGISVKGLPVKAVEWVLPGTMREFVTEEGTGAWANAQAIDVNGELIDLIFVVPDGKPGQIFPIEVTVQVLNGNKILGTETISGKVSTYVVATSVKLDQSELKFDLCGNVSGTLKATVKPDNHTEKLEWSSDNKEVATVKDGVVTAKKAGTATITVTAGSASASCTVTVTCSHKDLTKVEANAPTCTQKGNKAYYACSVCKQAVLEDMKTTVPYEDVILPMAEHTYGTRYETSETTHWRSCIVCGMKEEPVMHTYEWKVAKEPTEDETGLKHEECVCGKRKTENVVMDKLVHVHTGITHHEAVKATCAKPGMAAHWTCSAAKCAGKFYADDKCLTELKTVEIPIDPENHTGETVVKNAKSVTCEKDGYSGDTYCKGCNVLLKQGKTLYKTGHNPKHVAEKAPTCLQDGMKEHFECSNCGQCYAVENGKAGAVVEKSTLVIPATGHKFEDGKWGQDAQNHWQLCVCGEAGEKQAHTVQLQNAKEATETEDGYTGDEVCTVCGYVVKQGEAIPALGAGEPDTQASVPTTGSVEEDNSTTGTIGGIIAIIAAAVVVCGGILVLILKPWKKK